VVGVWWNHILTRIRECDVFVFAVSPESLDSQACKHDGRQLVLIFRIVLKLGLLFLALGLLAAMADNM
jgi:hypothetical protein